jgi:predicted permease
MLTRLLSIARGLLRRSRIEEDLDDELRFHLRARADDLERAGAPRAEAERRARLEFGAVDGCKEDCREARGLRLLDELVGNVRYAIRSVRHAPGVAAVAVVSLALGIGVNTAIFSVVNAVVLKRLPVEDPDRLVALSWRAKEFPERYLDSVEGTLDTDPATGWSVSPDFPVAAFEAIATHNRVFSHLLAFSDNTAASNVSLGNQAEAGEVLGVSGSYFDTLGVRADSGRLLHASDDTTSAQPVAVVSWRFWQRMLGGRPAAGTVLVVNGAPVTVVGVAPRGFNGLQPENVPDLYVPLHAYVEHYRRAFAYDLRDARVWWLTIVGRLAPGVTEARARADAGGLFHGSLAAAGRAAGEGTGPTLFTAPVGRGLDGLRKRFSPVLGLMMSMVGVVLLVACANVASLLVARTMARHRDLAVRISLGASRGRVVRQLLTESILLGLAGGALGMVLGAWISQGVAAVLADGPREPIVVNLGFDTAVLAFTLLVSMASGAIFGVVPALRAARADPAHALTRRSDAGLLGGHTARPGKLLVGAQVALSLLLLTGAGLLVGTLGRLREVSLGFDPRGLVVLRVQPGLNGYADERLAAYYDGLQRELGRVPGVRGVALAQRGLIGDGWSQGMAELPGSTPPQGKVRFWRQWVSAHYFETMGIPLVAGRRVEPGDQRTAPKVVVVNQRFVRDYLRGQNPIGRIFKSSGTVATIVGVVGDTKFGSLRDEAPPTVYLPYLQPVRGYAAFLIVQARVEGPVEPVMAAIQRAVIALDPTVPPVMVRTQQEAIDRALFTERALAVLSGTFGLLALVLACVGTFGTMSYSVARRTGEIGVRMALGAPRWAVVRMIMRETLVITVAGIAAGLPLAWMGTRLMKSVLYGLSPHDPGTVAAAACVILSIVLLAGALPAIRASRVDPMTALRDE